MNKEQIKIMNKTARSKGLVGKNAVLPRYIMKYFKWDEWGTILDFGAGSNIIHTKMLREAKNCAYQVEAYDIGDNFIKGVHTEIENQEYDIIFASNVMNILPSIKIMRETIGFIHNLLEADGCALFNFPKSPRKLNISDCDFKDLLYGSFETVKIVKYNTTKIFVCRIY